MNRLSIALVTATAGALISGLMVAGPASAATDIDKPPMTTVNGSMAGPIGIERDSAGNIYVASQLNNAVVVHASNASGSSGPLRVITGALTGISTPRDVALDANGFLYVVNASGNVNVFSPGQSGNVAPVKVFGTGAGGGYGIDVAGNGEIYVRKFNGYQVYVPSASGSPAPTKRAVTGLGVGFSIAVSGNKVWTPSGTQLRAYATSADGVAAPAQTIVDAYPNTEVNGLDTDAAGRIYATAFSQGTVRVFAGNATGSAAPLKVLGGPASGINMPTGLTVLPSGAIAVANYVSDSYSTFSALFPKPATVPSKVRALKVSGAKKAKTRTVSWKTPASNGGATITGYRIVIKKGSKTLYVKNVSASKRSLKVKRSKLRNGKNVVYVQAKNSVGRGPMVKKVFRVKK